MLEKYKLALEASKKERKELKEKIDKQLEEKKKADEEAKALGLTKE